MRSGISIRFLVDCEGRNLLCRRVVCNLRCLPSPRICFYSGHDPRQNSPSLVILGRCILVSLRDLTETLFVALYRAM